MKKFVTITIAICLVITLLSACTNGTGGTPGPSDVITTEPVTTEPTTELTPLPTDETGKNLIEGFESGTAEELMTSLDWSGLDYGISNPELSIADSGGGSW